MGRLAYSCWGSFGVGVARSRIRWTRIADHDPNDALSLVLVSFQREPDGAPRAATAPPTSCPTPPHHFLRKGVENHRQIQKLPLQSVVGDVRYPQLINSRQLHAAGRFRCTSNS